ncbi:MAG: hypothetical protein LBT76_02590, partial [Tannerella sp.]|nr:hypothetical protein [Tannerella sp.]
MARKDIFKSILVITALFLQFHLQAQQSIDLYVSPEGNDQNAGTPAQPLKTMAGARDVVRGRSERGTVPVNV